MSMASMPRGRAARRRELSVSASAAPGLPSVHRGRSRLSPSAATETPRGGCVSVSRHRCIHLPSVFAPAPSFPRERGGEEVNSYPFAERVLHAVLPKPMPSASVVAPQGPRPCRKQPSCVVMDLDVMDCSDDEFVPCLGTCFGARVLEAVMPPKVRRSSSVRSLYRSPRDHLLSFPCWGNGGGKGALHGPSKRQTVPGGMNLFNPSSTFKGELLAPRRPRSQQVFGGRGVMQWPHLRRKGRGGGGTRRGGPRIPAERMFQILPLLHALRGGAIQVFGGMLSASDACCLRLVSREVAHTMRALRGDKRACTAPGRLFRPRRVLPALKARMNARLQAEGQIAAAERIAQGYNTSDIEAALQEKDVTMMAFRQPRLFVGEESHGQSINDDSDDSDDEYSD